MAPFSSPSLGVSQDLHHAIKVTYSLLHPIFPVSSLEIVLAYDKTQPASTSGAMLSYFVCLYARPPADPRQRILCFKGQHATDADEALKTLLLQLRTEHADAVRATFEARAPGGHARSTGAWTMYWRAKHSLLGEAEERFVAAETRGVVGGDGVMGQGEGVMGEMPPAYCGGGVGGR